MIAFTDELDQWMKRTSNNSRSNTRLSDVIAEGKQLRVNAKVLEQNMQLLHQNIVRMVRISRTRSSRVS